MRRPPGLGFLRGARPTTPLIVTFIDEHKDRFGVAPICAVLSEHGVKIAPSTYYDARNRQPSKRRLRDAELIAVIEAERQSKFVALLGARKMWLRLRGKGHDVARCTVERLMREMGVAGMDPRSDPSATPTTTPSQSPRSGSTRASSSTLNPGGTRSTSRSRHWTGSTGSTLSDPTRPSMTSPRRRWRSCTTLTELASPRRVASQLRLRDLRGGSLRAACGPRQQRAR